MSLQKQPSSVATLLPLALITCASMLAMDLYLPSVPSLQTSLALTVQQGQATITAFLIGLAVSQLVWGEALHRIGPRACVRVGLASLAVASAGCALASGDVSLLVWRLAQGMAAGAATVVSPAVLRTRLSEQDAVRGIAAISVIESIVPAAGPVAGAVLLRLTDWRGLFATVAVLGLLALPFALRVTPREAPTHTDGAATGYLALISDSRFVRLGVAHGLSIAALFTFVASAPQLLDLSLALGADAFAALQVVGVSAFIIAASLSGRLSSRLGTHRLVPWGAAIQWGLCALLVATAWADQANFPFLCFFWASFCVALGLRGPPGFADALSVPHAQMGRAAGALVLSLLILSAICVQGAASFLTTGRFAAVGCVMFLASGVSLLLVTRYPARVVRPATG